VLNCGLVSVLIRVFDTRSGRRLLATRLYTSVRCHPIRWWYSDTWQSPAYDELRRTYRTW